MDHPAIESLHEYVDDKVRYHIQHGVVARELEEHLLHCKQCQGYIALLEYPQKKRREKGFAELASSLRSHGISMPKQYLDGAECVDIETLANFEAGVLAKDQTLKVEQHLIRCHHCASVVQGVWNPDGIEQPEPLQPFPNWLTARLVDFFRRFWLETAWVKPALTVIVVGFAIVGISRLLNREQPVQSKVRLGKPSTQQFEIQLLKPGRGDSVSIANDELQWAYAEQTKDYRYEVVFWDISTSTKHFRITALDSRLSLSQIPDLQSSKTYEWMVGAYVGTEAEEPVGKSDTWKFYTKP